MRNALIKIKGTQESNGESNVIELATEGTIEETEEAFVIRYDESEMLQCENTKTTLIVDKSGTAVIERTGGICSRLTIKQGARNNCYYDTPHGSLVIGIFGEKIKNGLTEYGGEVEMIYSMDSDLKPISRNTINISVSEVENQCQR